MKTIRFSVYSQMHLISFPIKYLVRKIYSHHLAPFSRAGGGAIIETRTPSTARSPDCASLLNLAWKRVFSLILGLKN